MFLKTKKWELHWYYYLDIIIYFLSSYSLYFWFLNLAKRETFILPFEQEADFELWNKNREFIKNFFTVAPIAVVFLCFKNVQIFSSYFPAFGVLFDTLKKSRNSAFTFLILLMILTCGFMIASFLFFGNWIEDFSSIP